MRKHYLCTGCGATADRPSAIVHWVTCTGANIIEQG